MVDLHPSGYIQSYAYFNFGTQQVGQGVIGGNTDAMLWSGTAASAVDLNPSGFTTSLAQGTNGSQQVGYGRRRECTCITLVWYSASAVDLQALLPASGNWVSSRAFTVDADGNIFGTAKVHTIA